jgi:hypothetical protein
MRITPTTVAVAALLCAVLGTSSGCRIANGWNPGLFLYPIPVSPFFQDRLEDKFWMHERYDRVPIMGPVTSGGEPRALDPPSPDEIMRALEKARPVEGGVPLLHEVQRNNVRIVPELIADYCDPPRVYPTVGPAQQHHAHYKCTIYFTETTHEGWPVPHTKVDDTVEVVYIDHNHLHMMVDADDTATSNY